jgi:hypothetical protein
VANVYWHQNHVGVVWQGGVVVVGNQTELLGLTLAVMENDGALPTASLVVVEFAEVGDHLLAGSGVGANALDQGIVGVLRCPAWPGARGQIKGVGLHYIARKPFLLPQNKRSLQNHLAETRKN